MSDQTLRSRVVEVIVPAETIMLRLRNETADLHMQAERRPLQQAMVRGAVSREQYAAFLGQMLLVHRALDAAVRAAASHPDVARVIRPEQFQERYLLSDLAYLGVDPATIHPLPATQAIIAEITQPRRDSTTVLGYHYVLEGAKNGNTYIAKALRKSLSLPIGSGDRYLDPYGDGQRAAWAQFKADMDAASFSREQADSMVVAARRMFQAVGDISDDVSSAAGM